MNSYPLTDISTLGDLRDFLNKLSPDQLQQPTTAIGEAPAIRIRSVEVFAEDMWEGRGGGIEPLSAYKPPRHRPKDLKPPICLKAGTAMLYFEQEPES